MIFPLAWVQFLALSRFQQSKWLLLKRKQRDVLRITHRELCCGSAFSTTSNSHSKCCCRTGGRLKSYQDAAGAGFRKTCFWNGYNFQDSMSSQLCIHCTFDCSKRTPSHSESFPVHYKQHKHKPKKCHEPCVVNHWCGNNVEQTQMCLTSGWSTRCNRSGRDFTEQQYYLSPALLRNQYRCYSVLQRPHSMFRHMKGSCLFDCRRTFTKSVRVPEEEMISKEDIKTFLVQANMKVEQGYTCFITRCPCLMQNKKSYSDVTDTDVLFVNMTTGHFLCKHCDKRGRWQDLQDNLLLLSSKKRKKDFPCFKGVDSVTNASLHSPQVQELWDQALALKLCSADISRQILEDFDVNVLEIKTLDKYSVKFDVQTQSLILPSFDFNGRLAGIRRLMCTIPEENDNLRVIQESVLPRSGPLGLFGFNTLSSAVKEVVLTSTELDAMAVCQETQTPSLALPCGFSSLPQEVLPALERFTKIVLWFGDDVRAWEAAKLFAKKLGNSRCYIIRPSEEDPSPLEALRRRIKLRQVLDKAKPIMHKSIVSFSQLRQEIFSELLHMEQVAGVKWKRYPLLNKLLKGHRRGELTVFTGPTGSGKTTFMSDYSLDLSMQGVNTLWGSFEINNIRLGKVMLTQFAQINLSKHLDQFDLWANRFEELPMYFMTFHGQESIRKVIEAMSHAVYVHDIAHVVVDNLQFMLGSNGEMGDRFAKQDTFISAFRRFATNMNCHVTVVIHPRKEKDSDELTTASVFGSAKATQEADNVLILQDKRLMSLRGRKYLQITKNRFDGELGVMLLKFDKETLSFAAKEKAKRPDAQDEEFLESSHHSTTTSDDIDH